MDHRKCAVTNCKFSTLKNIKLRAFPNIKTDKERCLKWIAACGNPKLQRVRHCAICDNHFENKYKLSKHLSRTAVPTLYLPEPIDVAGLENQPGPSIVDGDNDKPMDVDNGKEI
ncbi:uncharacterized protein LOC108629699 [Ceratina calcarata]|uniref:Uncharacterized protein LOC108629699 n=1 Tax=Ceratina calcarata TaxID=156304 RepID=A0AAJ7NC66_9HYME|nr:uncharacterized protein LOC108629699 [Ceratina calcarata]